MFNEYVPYNIITSPSTPSYITILTDKNVYNVGDDVKIFLQNTGSQSLVFTSTNSLLVIRNLGTGQSINLKMDTPFSLSPGETNTITWNQHDTLEHQVSSGNYIVTFYWEGTSTSADFSISRK